MSLLSPITDLPSHDAAIAHASSTCLVVIYVTSPSNPLCTRTTPQVEALARKYQSPQHRDADAKESESRQGNRGKVRFYSMPLTPQTAPMIKFGVQNTPIFILLREGWCETILGADLRKLEGMVGGWVG